MSTQALQLDREEALQLAELREVYQTTNTAGWQRIKKRLQSLVDEAHEDCFGAVFASAEVKAAFMTRWQQREAVIRDLNGYIASCEEQRMRILEEIKERENQERVSPYAASRTEEFA